MPGSVTKADGHRDMEGARLAGLPVATGEGPKLAEPAIARYCCPAIGCKTVAPNNKIKKPAKPAFKNLYNPLRVMPICIDFMGGAAPSLNTGVK